MSFFDDAISTIGRGLAQTAVQSVSDATGFDVGGTLNTLFGNGQSMGAQNLQTTQNNIAGTNLSSSDQAILTESMNQQLQQINDLGSQISSVATSLANISASIADLEADITKIQMEQTYQEWETVETAMIPYLAQVDVSYTRYGQIITNAVGMESTSVSQYLGDVLNTNDGPADASATINQYVLDTDGGRGALQLWSDMISGLVAAGMLDYREAVSRYMAYYQKLAYAQLQATNLVMEAYTFQGSNALVQDAWNTYRGYLLSQEAVFIRWLTPLVAAGVNSASVVTGGEDDYYYGVFSAIDAMNQLNPGLQTLPVTLNTANPICGFFEPTSVFRKAELLLATLYLTSSTDRRIVIHMLNDGDTSSVVENVTLNLLPQSGTSPVPPTRNPASPDQIPVSVTHLTDTNYNSGVICMKRFVYENDNEQSVLDDDIYLVQNLNGVPPLLPIETYAASETAYSPPQFMGNGPLAYQMTMSEETPFAFMNFLAYDVPQ